MKYYVNKNAQPTGEHEIHIPGCKTFPEADNAKYLGDFYFYESAKREANKYYLFVDACKNCLPLHHKK